MLDEYEDKNHRLLTQLALNTSQSTWSAYEQAVHIQKLLDEGIEQEDIQTKRNLGPQAIQQRLSLLGADEFIKEALVEKELSFSAARAIIAVPDKSLRESLVEEALSEGLSSRQVESRASELADKALEEALGDGGTPPRKKKKPKSQTSSVAMRTVTDILDKIEVAQEDLLLVKDPVVKSRMEGFIEGLQYSMVDRAILANERKGTRG